MNQNEINEQIKMGRWSHIHYYFYVRSFVIHEIAAMLAIICFLAPHKLNIAYGIMTLVGLIALYRIFMVSRVKKETRNRLKSEIFKDLILNPHVSFKQFLDHFFTYKKMRGRLDNYEFEEIQRLHQKYVDMYLSERLDDSPNKQSLALKELPEYSKFLIWFVKESQRRNNKKNKGTYYSMRNFKTAS